MRFISFISFIFFVSFSQAQVATLNSQKVLAAVPAIRQADSLIVVEKTKLEMEIAKLESDYKVQRSLADSLMTRKPVPPFAALAQSKASKMDQDIKGYIEQANKSLLEYSNQLKGPHLKRINEVIEQIARKHKYKQVLDIQQVALVWLDSSADMTQEVIQALK